MPLTPADVHNVAFSKPPIGKRGYNEDEVDQFLDLVEDALAQLQDENEDLRKKAASNQNATTVIPAAGRNNAADEASLRAEIESKIKADYEARLADAKKAAESAQTELRSVRDEAARAKNTAGNDLREELRKREAELKAAREEAAKAKSEAEQARKNSAAPQAAATGATTAASTQGLATPDTHMQAARVLGLAQEMADRLTTEAQTESKSMLDQARSSSEKQLADADARSKRQLEEARRQAEQATTEARNKAELLVFEANRKAEQTTNDANARAEAQVKQAQEKAAALQAEAERKHTEIMNTVKQQQTALEARIAELRTFEREYRTRLKTLLQSQLDELESRGSSAPNGGTGHHENN